MNLQKLAEKIKTKWPPVAKGEEGDAIFTRDGMLYIQHTCGFDPTDSDIDNSDWIIWCLDRLEELGMSPNLSCQRRDGRFDCMWLVSGPMEGTTTSTGEPIMDHKTMASPGKTRAEAVTLALAKALGVEDE
jgi:hypothetical protein